MRKVSCSLQGLEEAANSVKGGGLVVFPTDTVYGLGCDPFNRSAVGRLVKLKERKKKPLPVLCSSLKAAQEIAILEPVAESFAARFWPGPLTMVARLHTKKLPSEVTGGLDTVGVRVPNFGCTVKLLVLCGGYLVGTSANRAGGMPPRSLEEVDADLVEQVDVFVDGGRTLLGKESTVVSIIDGEIRLLRQGFWQFKDILGL